MELYQLLTVLIIFPLIASLLLFLIKKNFVRSIILITTAVILIAAAVLFFLDIIEIDNYSIQTNNIPIGFSFIIKLLNLVLMAIITLIGIKLRKFIIIFISFIQFIGLILFELLSNSVEPETAFYIDNLSALIILISSFIGSILLIFFSSNIGTNLHIQKINSSAQNRIAVFGFIIISSINSIVVVNNLFWFYLFWNINTLSVFLLVYNSKSSQSSKYSIRTLWFNLLGGAAILTAITLLYSSKKVFTFTELFLSEEKSILGIIGVGVALIALAGFIKMGMFPFQSYIGSAVVSPIPISAILFSSSILNAGIYLLMRISPLFSGILIGEIIAIAGAFTFLTATGKALLKKNGRSIIMYSAVANGGLVICCFGLGINIGFISAFLFTLIYVVSTSVIFITLGVIAEKFKSYDVENMQGIICTEPLIATVMVIGIILRLLSSLGLLIYVSIIISIPLILIMLILGCVFEFVYFTKWIGSIVTIDIRNRVKNAQDPYLCGKKLKGSKENEFIVRNNYFSNLVLQLNYEVIINLIGWAIILVMFGVVI